MAQTETDEQFLFSKPGRQQEPLNSTDPLHVSSSQSPWTSAKCHRLLRPLSSKIALLRKAKQFKTQQSEQGLGILGNFINQPTNSTGTSRSSGGSGTFRRATCPIATDEAGEWASSPRPSKKIRRTYSSRTKTLSTKEETKIEAKSRPPNHPGCAVIELPLELSFEAASGEASPCEESGQRPAQNSRDSCPPHDLPKNLAPSNWKLVDGICKGFVALLKATSVKKLPHTKGSRSLLCTCLNQIPQYIAEEEILTKAEDPDNDLDVSNLIYNDLEGLGSMPGGGWEPLRQLVRAHGIKMITNAIEEGLLGIQVSRHLFHLCLNVSAASESQYIVESLTKAIACENIVSAKSAGAPPLDLHIVIKCMGSLASSFGRNGFLYRHTAAMLDRGTLSIEWISSKAMIGTWNEVIRSVTQNDLDAQSAALLLQTAIAVSCKSAMTMPRSDVHNIRLRVRTAINRPILRSTSNDLAIDTIANTQPDGTTKSDMSQKGFWSSSNLFNVLTALSAIARLQSQGLPRSSDQSCAWVTIVLHDLALIASQAIESSSQGVSFGRPARPYPDSLRLSLIAASLAELVSAESFLETPEQCTPSLTRLAEISISDEIIKDAGPFICAVARCCGRAKSEDAFSVMKAIVQELTIASRSLYSSTSTQKLCKDLALVAAFTYSADTSQPVHLDWALQIELNLTGKDACTPRPAAVRTPARNKNSFRWEEGICEWIAKTPNLLLQKPAETNSDTDQKVKEPQAVCIQVKQALPSFAEISPCRTNKQTTTELGRRESGDAKALHVLIPVGRGRRGIDGAGRDSCFVKSQPCKRNLRSRPTHNIHEDQKLDEEPLRESSRETSFALSMLDGAPNTSVGMKRKRPSEEQQNPSRSGGHSHAQSKLQCKEIDRDSEMGDMDELALLFTW